MENTQTDNRSLVALKQTRLNYYIMITTRVRFHDNKTFPV